MTAPLSLGWLWPIATTLCNYEWLPSEMLYRHMGALFFEQTLLQASSVLLATAIIILPIYSLKVVKMRFFEPKFFPVVKRH